MTTPPTRLLDLVQQVLVSLVGMKARTTEQAAATDEAARKAIAAADRTRASGMDAAEGSAASAHSNAKAAHESATSDAKRRLTHKLRELARHEQGRRSQILDEKDEILSEAAERQAKHAWMAEATYEVSVGDAAATKQRADRHRDEIAYRHNAVLEAIEELGQRRKFNLPHSEDVEPPAGGDPDELMDHAEALLTAVQGDRKARLLRFLGLLLAFGVPTAAGCLVGVGMEAAITGVAIGAAAGVAGVGIMRLLTRRATAQSLCEAARLATSAMKLAEGIAGAAADAWKDRDRDSRRARDSARAEAMADRDERLDKAGPRTRRRIEKMQANVDKTRAAIEEAAQVAASEADETLASTTEAIEEKRTKDVEDLETAHEAAVASARDSSAAAWQTLRDAWASKQQQLMEQLDTIRTLTSNLAPTWPTWDADWTQHTLPKTFEGDVGIGRLHCDAAALHAVVPKDEGLQWSGPADLDLPLCLNYLGRGSLHLQCRQTSRMAGISMVQALVARTLTTVPPGQLRLTLYDPVGLGQSFAGFMHLADHEDANVLDRAWTEPRHLEQKLSDITEHMERVIQTFLRNEYESLDAYNRAAGQIAEPYHLLVLNDYPEGLTDLAAKRLASIMTSGPKCGVFVCLLQSSDTELPEALVDLDWSHNHVLIQERDDGWRVTNPPLADFEFTPDAPPADEQLTSIVKRVGEGAEGSNRVEVPFEIIAPAPDERWTRSTSSELRVAIGQSGATRFQEFKLGRGTTQHALIAGRTGSGKSTLLHVLITNLAMWHSPDELEFHLVDFKKGVEFQTYAAHRLPHARVVAIESDREFGLSVLRRLDRELRRRGDLFRDAHVQDLAGWRSSQPTPMPRVLLVVDEFQEFFVDDDAVAQEAGLLLDRLVRQGRAFGMHAVMGSQTLDGAFSLARSTLGQMGVRIALQCSESDSYLILSDDNPAARLLRRPGEAIYNDAGGKIEGNAPFQVVWLDDSARDTSLKEIASLDASRFPEADRPQFVFRGNIPSVLADNPTVQSLLAQEGWHAPEEFSVVLGDPIAIEDATSLHVRPRSGGNALMVGQNAEAANAIMTAALLQAAATMQPTDSPDSDGFMAWIFDGVPGDGLFAGRLAAFGAALGHTVTRVTERNLDEQMVRLRDILAERADGQRSGRARILLLGLEPNRIASLRPSEDDFSFSMEESSGPSADATLVDLLRDGPVAGINTILWYDSLNSLNRGLSRAAQREFDTRILFQMSANDSGQLIDSTTAADLGPGRALLYSEQTGVSEKFRPWAMPDESWLSATAASISAR